MTRLRPVDITRHALVEADSHELVTLLELKETLSSSSLAHPVSHEALRILAYPINWRPTHE